MTIPKTKLPSGEAIPVLGLGTWRMGEDRGDRSSEVRALRLGLELGLTLIDTAEMYGDGGAEEVVGDAIAGGGTTSSSSSSSCPSTRRARA